MIEVVVAGELFEGFIPVLVLREVERVMAEQAAVADELHIADLLGGEAHVDGRNGQQRGGAGDDLVEVRRIFPRPIVRRVRGLKRGEDEGRALDADDGDIDGRGGIVAVRIAAAFVNAAAGVDGEL